MQENAVHVGKKQSDCRCWSSVKGRGLSGTNGVITRNQISKSDDGLSYWIENNLFNIDIERGGRTLEHRANAGKSDQG